MGESPLESPTKVEKEMGESGTDQVRSGDVGGLRASVSFGKYENESLSWEKWSAFPTNKYLEEVGKFSTPGSVAQKKAYFEAHYKKIAARNQQLPPQQEQVDQEKMKGDELSHNQQMSLENRTVWDSRDNSCVVGSDVDDKSTVEDAVNEDEVECRNGGAVDSIREIGGGGCGDEPTVDDDFAQSNRLRLAIEDANDEFSTRADSPKSNKAEQLVFIREEAPSLGSQDMEGFHPNKETGAGGANVAIKELQQNVNSATSTPVQKPEKAESRATKKQQMVIAAKKPNGIAAIKKPNVIAAPKKKTAKPTLPKSVFSTPKTEKPALSKPVTSTPKTAPSKSLMSTTKSSVKKENDYRPLTTSNKTTKTESKRVAPTSLHMSLSLGPAKSMLAGSLPETRKSLFVDSMGDKEIVRRAFKAFQNRYNQKPSSGVQEPSPTTQVSKNELEPRGSAFDTSQVKSKGVPKAVAVVQKSPQGTKRIFSMSPGSLETGVAVQRNGTNFSASVGSRRSVDKLSKKSEDKSNGKQAVKIQLQNKPKMQEREETKKLGQSLELKSKPTAASYRRPAVTVAN